MLDHTDLPHAMDLMYCGGDDAMHTMYQRHTVVTWFIVIRDVLFIVALIRPFRPEHRPPNPVSLCWLCAGSSFHIILPYAPLHPRYRPPNLGPRVSVLALCWLVVSYYFAFGPFRPRHRPPNLGPSVTALALILCWLVVSYSFALFAPFALCIGLQLLDHVSLC